MKENRLPEKKTKVICTIGPASDSEETLTRMARAGMNICRLNFSHGDFKSHRRLIRLIRKVSKKTGIALTLLADLPGPKMRIGKIEGGKVILKRAQAFILDEQPIPGNQDRVYSGFKGLSKRVRPGDLLYLSDGFISLRVEKIQKDRVHCRVLAGGELRSSKGLNLPGIELGVSAFTDKDKAWLNFAIREGVDAVSQSFVANARDILALKAFARKKGAEVFVFAKIERCQALPEIEKILDAADGIMVARGDLGVEVPIEKVGVLQKNLISSANRKSKPVITATHMMESMVVSPRPTRAEVTDVTNAVLDGSDCVMLSEESAMGSFPVETVEVMAKIVREAEIYREKNELPEIVEKTGPGDHDSIEDLIAQSVHWTIHRRIPEAVVAPTWSGKTARSISRFKLPVWVIGISPHLNVCRELQFSYGVFAVHAKVRSENLEVFARQWLQSRGFSRGIALMTQGLFKKKTGGTNRLDILELTGKVTHE